MAMPIHTAIPGFPSLAVESRAMNLPRPVVHSSRSCCSGGRLLRSPAGQAASRLSALHGDLGVRRRDLLGICTTAAAGALLLPRPAPAAPARDASPDTADQMLASPVRPALTPRQYMDKIVAARPAAMQQLRELLEAGKYKGAAESLVLYPFDDVAQSAFYLPWALLEVDIPEGVKVQRAYLTFRDSLIAFERACREAASYRAEEEEVQGAFDQMSSALEALVSAVA